MKLRRYAVGIGDDGKPAVVVPGLFDGVHIGHRQVLRRAVDCARALTGRAVAVTWPAPRFDAAGAGLGSLRQRLERIAAEDVGVVLLRRAAFEARATAAAAFVRDALLGQVGTRRIVVGEDEFPPVEREALLELARSCGIEMESVPVTCVQGVAVSAAAIRSAVGAGDLDRAALMLGRPYGVCGRVVQGHRRGRLLGFPTANLALSGVQLPPDGVYAIRARAAAQDLSGLANIGFNPTFGVARRSVEAHLFDFNGDLYGRRVEVSFIARLRGEQKFPGPEALVAQIRADAAAARAILACR